MEKMNFAEFQQAVLKQQATTFAAFVECFNEEMKKRGGASTFEDVIGGRPVDKVAREALLPTVFMPEWSAEKTEQLADLFLEIYGETSDADPRDVILRALATYRHFVKHARAGGQVKFVGIEGAKDRVLTVRLK